MGAGKRIKITVSETVEAPVRQVWKCWTDPGDITRWNSASEDWHTPWAENDLRPGGKFLSRMEARDGSMGFDFGGVYDEVRLHERIEYTMDDGRQVVVTFNDQWDRTVVTETFDAEFANPEEMQRKGWQAIMTNFKKYVESRAGQRQTAK